MSITGWIGCGIVTTLMNFFTDLTTSLLGSVGGGVTGFIIPGALLLLLFAFSKKHAFLLAIIFGVAISMCGASLPI